MMDHIRQRDWNSTKNLHNQFVDEQDIDNCAVERIIRNRFWDPMISSDEEGPPGPIDWDSIFTKKSSRENQYRRFVPGFRKPPPHPKLSALTQQEHRQCIKVLSYQNEHILPHEYVGKPSKADWRVFEEKKEIYAKEQEEYIEWARHLWTTTNCIRALRPKPLVELVYEAEFKVKSYMVQSFPKNYRVAAQIPLRAENHACEIILPKTDLIKVDISKLPQVCYPNIHEVKESIIVKCPIPEPCKQHPCKFVLPNETEVSMLPLTELHKELAQFASDNGAGFLASEGALRCLLETDRAWSLPLSACEVIGPDGEKTSIIVLGSEFPEKKEPAPTRSYRAFRHLLLHAFTSHSSRRRTYTDQSDSSHRSLRSHNTAKSVSEQRNYPTRGAKCSESHSVGGNGSSRARKVINYEEASDSSDEERLEIVMDDDSQNNSEIDDNSIANDLNYNHNSDDQPRKILRARPRLSLDRKNQTENGKTNSDRQEATNKMDRQQTHQNDCQELTDNQEISNQSRDVIMSRSQVSNHSRHSSKMNLQSSQTDAESGKMDSQSVSQTDKREDGQANGQQEAFDVGLFDCVCKDTVFETPPPRSYKNLLIKNNTTKDQLNVIVHCSHKLKNASSHEVLLEPIPEYQLDIGGSQHSPEKLQALALALMLRRLAHLTEVRIDGACGDLVTLESSELRGLAGPRGELRPTIANTLHTALAQLAGLLPGAYVLRHEPSHGANAVLYSRARAAEGARPLQAREAALAPAEEARLAQAAPRLAPALLPLHKYRRQLPLAFTYSKDQVAKECNKLASKKKTPPAALEWPKKGKRKGRKK